MADKKKQQRNLKIVSAILGAILCVVFIPVLILNLTLIIKGFSKPNEVPDVFGICPIIETNDLMSGNNSSIKNGDLLFFKKGDYDYKQGDTDGTIVAIMTANNTVVVRRLIASTTDAAGNVKYVAIAETKAEGTRMEVSEDQIVGALTFRVAGLGDVVLFSHKPLGTFLIVVLPICLLFILEYFIYKHDREMNEAQATTVLVPDTKPMCLNRYLYEDDDEYVIAEMDLFLTEDGKTVAKNVKK